MKSRKKEPDAPLGYNFLLYPCPFPQCFKDNNRAVFAYDELLEHLMNTHHELELFGDRSTEEFITPYLINEEPS